MEEITLPARLGQTTQDTADAARGAAERVLEAYAASPSAAGGRAGDPGPAILAALVAAGQARPPELAGAAPASRALVAWLGQLRRPAHMGLLGSGAAGQLLALRVAASTWPRLAGLAEVARRRLSERVAAVPWAATSVGWNDYDLVTGPAGILLALAADPAASAADRAPLVAHLARLCARDDLAGLCVGQYRDDELRSWNFGRINLGLAHGLPGVAAALRAAADADGLTRQAQRLLRRIAGRLVDEAFTDQRGVLSWHRRSGRRSSPASQASYRQAWCYGCPGVAWTLWEVGRVLGDASLREFAVTAAGSLIAAWDDDFYLDGLDICHGAAGLLLLFDSFSRHAGLPGAAGLRDHLAGHLLGHLAAAERLAGSNCSLQSGGSGVIAALLTACGGDRRWLAAAGLR